MSTVTVCAVNDIVQVSYFQAIAATVLQILAPCGPSQRLLQHAFRILDKSLLAEKLRPGFLHTLTHFTFFLTSHTDCPSSTVSPSSFIPPPALHTVSFSTSQTAMSLLSSPRALRKKARAFA